VHAHVYLQYLNSALPGGIILILIIMKCNVVVDA
jgi:hypothetical protein